MYSPFTLGITYVNLRRRYFPKYKGSNFNPDDFKQLALFLQKENVNPTSYIDFVFGMLDYERPLIPKSLADPLLMAKYRQMIR